MSVFQPGVQGGEPGPSRAAQNVLDCGPCGVFLRGTAVAFLVKADPVAVVMVMVRTIAPFAEHLLSLLICRHSLYIEMNS